MKTQVRNRAIPPRRVLSAERFFVCTYVGLLQAEEDSSRLDDVFGAGAAPGDLSRLHTGGNRGDGDK